MHLRFKAFLAGSLLSRMGDHLAEFGLMLLLLERYPGRLAPALGFGITRGLVSLLIGPRLGALFDRFPTRRVLTGAILVQVISLTAFALVSLLPEVPPPLFWACGAGLAMGSFTYETGLTYSLLPQLAQGLELTRLNAVFHSLAQIGEVVGPVVAGFLFARWGASGVIGADVLTFVAELAGIWLVSVPLRASAASSPQEAIGTPGLWRRLRLYHRALPLLVISVGFAWCNGMSPHSTAFTFFLRDHLGVDAVWLGWIRTFGALAGISGAILSPWLTRTLGGQNTVMAAGIGLEALALIGAAWWRESLIPLVAWVVVSRFGLSAYLLAAVRIRQELIPANVRGITNGQINAFFRGMGLLNMLAQTGLDHSSHAFTLLAWGTALAIGTAAVFGYAAFRRLETSGSTPVPLQPEAGAG